MFNIVFMSPHSDPEARLGEVDSGGQCIYEYQLAHHLSQLEDVSVTVYTRQKFGHPEVSHISDRFIIKRIKCGGEKFIPKEQLGHVLPEFVGKVVQDLNGTKVDIIHGHYWDGGASALLLAGRLDYTPGLVWTPHSPGTGKRKRFPGMENELTYRFIPRIAWESYSVLISEQLIVSTKDEKRMMIDHYQADPDIISVAPPGIDVSDFEPVSREECRERFGLPKDEFILMSFGRLDERKGYHYCIPAFADFKKKYKKPARLVIFAGSAQSSTKEQLSYLKDLKKLAKKMGVDKQVEFRDAVEHADVKYIFGASDIYLGLSEYEPFGIAILEAMYAGLPVISTNNGGPNDIITQHKDGVLVNSANSKRVADEALRIAEDEAYRKKLTTNARRFIKSEYTWEACARRFLEIYHEVDPAPTAKLRRKMLNDIRMLRGFAGVL